MATKQDFIDYVLEQLQGLGDVRARKMFGEYAVYYRDKVIGLVCDNQLFIKITEAGNTFYPDAELGKPYQGAKDAFLISDKISDNQWLCDLIRISEPEISLPRKRKKR